MLRRVFFFLALSFLLQGTALARQLTIGMPCLNDKCELPAVESFFREAYRRIGQDVTFVSLPSLLELDFADSGRTDGSMLRTELVASEHPNLVKVPCPLLFIDFMAFSVRDDIKISRTDDLVGYRVGISRGNLTAGMLCREAEVEPVLMNSLTSGIRMLEEGRIDVILEERNTMEMTLSEVGRQLYRSKSLLQGRLYHWLNKRNADLARPLAEVFRAMIAEGAARKVFGENAETNLGSDF